MRSRVGGVCSLACHGEHITVNREHTVDTIQQHVPRLRGVWMGLKRGGASGISLQELTVSSVRSIVFSKEVMALVMSATSPGPRGSSPEISSLMTATLTGWLF